MHLNTGSIRSICKMHLNAPVVFATVFAPVVFASKLPKAVALLLFCILVTGYLQFLCLA